MTGAEYPLGPVRQTLSYAATALQMGALAFLYAGEKIFPALGMPIPALYYKAQESKMMSYMIAFFGFNFVKGQISSTGAFEIFLDNELIYSKLQTGRMPDMNELLHLIP